MTLYDLISCHTLINDDTRLGLILYDPARCVATAQYYGHWYEDAILDHMEWTVERFTYFAEQNRVFIRITQEGAKMKNLIDIDKLRGDMYKAAFEEDTEMQRWDSGCWIRYKLFEKVLNAQPVYIMDDKHCPFCGAELKEGATQ